jgi:hypothetical protein
MSSTETSTVDVVTTLIAVSMVNTPPLLSRNCAATP